MILISIAIIVLFNFYIKKDLYFSLALGLILSLVYLEASFRVSLLDLASIDNAFLILRILTYLAIIYSFKRINDETSFTKTKKSLQNISSLILKDKKIKIFTLIILGCFFSFFPYIGLIYLATIAVYFRISKINMALVPIIMIAFFNIFLSLQKINVNYDEVNVIGLTVLYILFLIFVMIEKLRKKEHFDMYTLIINAAFIAILYIINIIVDGILVNIYPSNSNFILSLFLVWIIANIMVSKFPVLIEQEQKEYVTDIEENFKNLIPEIKLPILMIFIFVLASLGGYYLLSINYFIGSFVIVGVNAIVLKGLKRKLISIKVERLWTILLILGLIFLETAIIKTVLTRDISLGETVNLNLVLLSQILITTPVASAFTNLSIETLSGIISTKMGVITLVQTYFSLVTIFILQYVFSFEKEEVLRIFTLMIISSLLIQIIIYVY